MKTMLAFVFLTLGCAASAAVKSVPQNGTFGQPADEQAAQMGLPQSDASLWTLLRQTKVSEDAKRGLYTASFPADVKALSGQTVTLTGFMLPIDAWTHSKHFLLSKYTPVCAFCPPGAPNEVVEVIAPKSIKVTEAMITVTGKFSLANDSEKGLFFRIEGGATQ
ncbi:MAG TPA: DUF3299 domain-containing protein [Magnetospirillaceae bacterium]|nr:DUF3299 domain-containing protein [Magnetospirillaceae bacterium]